MVEPRENRIHMYLSNEEMTAIDDWRFSNRVATRSEAIRRLCQIALKTDEQADFIYKAVQAAAEWTIVAKQYLPDLPSHGEGEEIASIEKQVNLFTSVILLTALQTLRDAKSFSNSLKEDTNFQTAILKAAEMDPKSKDTWEFIQSFYQEYRERFPGKGISPSSEWLDEKGKQS